MMPRISETVIRQNANAQSYERGQNYFRRGAVFNLQRRGAQITADVEGSDYDPYRVEVTFDGADLQNAFCTCPYDWCGYCKHIVAVFLAISHSPEKIDERPSLDDLLSGLDEDQLRKIVTSLVENHPGFVDEIEGLIRIQGLVGEARKAEDGSKAVVIPRQRQTALDPEVFRRQAHRIIHSLDRMSSSDAYWQVDKVVSQLSDLANQAWKFIEAGDGENALVILDAITEEYVDEWLILDDSNGDASGFFENLGNAWTEAILSADPSPESRTIWAKKLSRWQKDIDDYAPDFGFDAAISAAQQGWDAPALLRVLEQGKITQKGVWEGEAPWHADELALARLNVLARQNRTQEYLYLAEAEGQIEQYLTMLAKLGHTSEAVEKGLAQMSSCSEALALAKTLSEQGEVEAALRIAEHGLALEGYNKSELARWLRDATKVRQPDLALRAAEIAFNENYKLADYLAIEELAGEDWPQCQTRLLKHLKAASYSSNKIDIYLHEEMLQEAMQVVDRSSYFAYADLNRVIEAAASQHPDWALRKCQQQAENIMDAGQSKNYDRAVEWLRQAKSISLTSGRKAEWQDYLGSLLALHVRKYSLMPRLKTLI